MLASTRLQARTGPDQPAPFPQLQPAQPGTSHSPPAPGGVPVASVQMLVAVSSAMPDPVRRRELAREAETGLVGLEQLHQALIGGVVPPDRLRTLRDWARRRGKPSDPILGALMDDIELRILVELAKLDRSDV